MIERTRLLVALAVVLAVGAPATVAADASVASASAEHATVESAIVASVTDHGQQERDHATPGRLLDRAVAEADAAASVVVPDLPMLAPLAGYSRYDETELLAHETRQSVHDAVADTPGIHLAGLATAVDEPLSTVRYHGRVLQSAGLIESEKRWGRKRFFPAATDPASRSLQTALADDPTRSVLLSVARTEPVSLTDLAAAVERAPSTVSHHLQRLEADDLVVRERNGEAVETGLAPAVRAALD